MKIVHPQFTHQIEIKEGSTNLIVIEKPQLFYEIVKDLQVQCNEGQEGKLVLSNQDNILSFEKNTFLVINPFQMDVNDKKILNRLFVKLKEEAYSSELYLNTNKLMSELIVYFESLNDNSEFPVNGKYFPTKNGNYFPAVSGK